jgi:hypothetical protein
MERIKCLIFDHGDRGFGWIRILIANSAPKCCSATAGDARPVAALAVFMSTTFVRGADWVMIQTKI